MKGIIFQPDLVGVLLERGSIQTRRAVKPQPIEGGSIKRLMRVGDGLWSWQYLDCNGEVIGQTRCPYGPVGTKLYIKEPWRFGQAPNDEPKQGIAMYEDSSATYHPDLDPKRRNWSREWKPVNTLFMPQWASRAIVEIVHVDVARLDHMTEADAIASGAIEPHADGQGWLRTNYLAEYAALWDRINGKRQPWEPELWVWVLDLKVVAE